MPQVVGKGHKDWNPTFDQNEHYFYDLPKIAFYIVL